MLIVPPPKVRNHRKPAKRAAVVPAALVLQSADYDSDALELTLGFDRAIDISAFNGAAITVNDGLANRTSYQGTTAALSSANVVVIELEDVGVYGGADLNMSATAASGIVAVSGGDAWAGVTDLNVPYP